MIFLVIPTGTGKGKGSLSRDRRRVGVSWVECSGTCRGGEREMKWKSKQKNIFFILIKELKNLIYLIKENTFIILYIININKLEIKFFSFINTRANSYTFINIKLI